MKTILKIAAVSSALALMLVGAANAQQASQRRSVAAPISGTDAAFEGRSVVNPNPALAPNEVDETGNQSGAPENPQMGD
jgi:hypothetical protein